MVLAELLHARARRSSRTEAAHLAGEFVAVVDAVVPLTDASRRHAIALFADGRRISSNDAMIAAVAFEHGAVLITADQDFEAVTGLNWLTPDSPDLKSVIGR